MYLFHLYFLRSDIKEYMLDAKHGDIVAQDMMELGKYLRDVNKRKTNTDYISVIVCILYALFLNKFTSLK